MPHDSGSSPAPVLTVMASLVLALLAAAGLWLPQPAQAADAPGTLIRAEPMPGAPDGATAYRILYASEGLDGQAIPVSGVIIVPPGPAPAEGRPVVAWAHPTTGVVSRCAPSLARVLFAGIQGREAMLARGYVVAATDYPGLGTPQTHPYLVGLSEGRAVLDSVRAARQIEAAGAGRAFAVWGHSQGGHASLFAGLLARSYAPELRLAGIAAAAPATDLAALMRDDAGTGGGNNITAMTLWSWSRVYGIPLTGVVAPAAIPALDQLVGECIERWFDVLARSGPTQVLQKGFLEVDDLSLREPWRRLLAENSPGPLPARIPVFISQGTADGLVRPAVTLAYVDELCRGGSAVRFVQVPDAGHAFIARDTAREAVAWMADRFAGAPAPQDCGG